jgi:hypothetical protein
MCIKLVIKTNLYYEARSEKHQKDKPLCSEKIIGRYYNSYKQRKKSDTYNKQIVTK